MKLILCTDQTKYLNYLKGRRKKNSNKDYLSLGMSYYEIDTSYVSLAAIASNLADEQSGVYERPLIKECIKVINHEILHQVVWHSTRADHPERIVELLNGERRFKKKR